MLKIENVHKTFNAGTVNEKKALRGLNLHLKPGEFVTVIGGNGAGKSTMLNIIAGTYPVDAGSITLDGVDLTRLPEHKRAQYQGAVDVNMGRGAIVIGLAAVIIGEVLLSKVFRNFALKLTSVVIGAVIYYIVLQAVLQLGLNTNDLKLLTAAIVAMFLAVPYWKQQYFHTKSRKEKTHA